MTSCGVTAIFCFLAAAGVPIDFDTHIMPVLTKSGCNAGACHGAALGQGGFKLSLWGQLPEEDYSAIVSELEGRRVNLAQPAHSLLLTKPTERVDHEGGLRLQPGSSGESLLMQWIASGAPRSQSRRLVDWDIQPRSIRLESPGDAFELRVTARFDDGQTQDVTAWTVVTPVDPAALLVEDSGRIVVRRRGVHAMLLRYLDRVAAVQVIVPLGEKPLDLSGLPRTGPIDEHVLKLLESLRIEPSPPADDATFLRRARLDLTGRLPSLAEAREYLADERPDKRERLVKRLVGSVDFLDFWSYKWSRWLRIESGKVAAEPYYKWLRTRISENISLDRLAVALIEAEGDSHTVGPANFTRATPGPREQAEHVSQLFLGARLGCANCHNHPLDRWTQDDYHGLAAIFARLDRGSNVRLTTRGEVTHPRTGQPAVPRLPGVDVPVSEDRGRHELAAWIASPQNPHFARACVNRMWREMFGRGLVDPVDDLRDTNPATHPELLERLAEDFAEGGFDMRALLRQIAMSDAYGRGGPSADMPAAVDRFYACMPARPLTPEVLMDALCDVTGVSEEYKQYKDGDNKLPAGTRAIGLYDLQQSSNSLAILGRCQRAESCDTAPGPATLAARLHQINGPLLNVKIASPQGILHHLLISVAADEAILEAFYLRALSRFPTTAERQHWLRVVSATTTSERQDRWEDLVWGLLNCQEFTTNH